MPSIVDRAQGMLTNLNPDNIFSLLDNPVMAKVWFFIKLVGVFGVFVLGIIVIYKAWFEYKIKMTLIRDIGVGGKEIIHDRAKIVTDKQGKMKLQVYKTRMGTRKPITAPIPAAVYKTKMGRSDHYFMFLDDNYELHPVKEISAMNNFERLEIMPQERRAWRRNEDDILLKKYRQKDKLLQYATPAILMTAMIVSFLIFFFGFKELGNGMASLAGSFQQVASSCTRLTP